jgi:hypothetical protein
MSDGRFAKFGKKLYEVTLIKIHNAKNTQNKAAAPSLAEFVIEKIELIVNNEPKLRRVYRVHCPSEGLEIWAALLSETNSFYAA